LIPKGYVPQPDSRNQIKQSRINNNALSSMTETDFPSTPDPHPWHVAAKAALGEGVERKLACKQQAREEKPVRQLHPQPAGDP
jgi:hypothetical protein